MTFSSNFLYNEIFNTVILHERLLVREPTIDSTPPPPDYPTYQNNRLLIEPQPKTPPLDRPQMAGSRSSSESSPNCPRSIGEKRSYEDASYISSHNTDFGQVNLQNPYTVHAMVVQTIRKEFEMEDKFFNSNGKMSTSNRARRRRNPSECVWKPESVYKSYVELKPYFFDKSNYQSYVPRCSCFGKINMRIPKAWTRGPNKAKRRKSEPKNINSRAPSVAPQVDRSNEQGQSFDDIFSFDFLYK